MRDSYDSSNPDIQASGIPRLEAGVSEGLLHAEHEAALEETLFLKGDRGEELVFELSDGELHLVDPEP
ncbi:MAG: hypothetical protein VX252_11225 [Myxococcota bacterium]|nr:hypothetical protein [Myxococcota bacterium]